jgi:hypothetical protein
MVIIPKRKISIFTHTRIRKSDKTTTINGRNISDISRINSPARTVLIALEII